MEVAVARVTQSDEILKALLRIVLVRAVMYLQPNVSVPTQAAAIAVSGVDAPFEYCPFSALAPQLVGSRAVGGN
jgi:hypothetical protein